MLDLLSSIGFIILVMVFGGLMWSAICLLIGVLAGWQQLGRVYGTDAPAPHPAREFASGGMGLMSYSSCMRVAATPTGLDLRVLAPFRPGHPPLLVPWTDISDEGRALSIGWELAKLRLGPDGPSLRIRRSVWEDLRAQAGAAG